MILMLLLAGSIATSCNNTGANSGNAGTTHKTESGMEYLTYKELSTETPKPGDYVFFHVQMRNDSAVLDGSRIRGGQQPRIQIPVEDVPGRRVSPVEEVLKVMGVGDSVTLLVHFDTVPVNQRPPGFADNDLMYYDIICTDIQSQADYEAKLEAERQEQAAKTSELQKQLPAIKETIAKDIAAYKAGSANLQKTASGLKYMILEEGTGPQAAPGKVVSVHYYGSLLDGTMFDNSFDRGQPIEFLLGRGQVIPGWDEGLALLKEGAKAIFFIPSQLAYGDRETGKIPANSELVFYVDLMKVK